jgi:HTH-type transcriptional regulator/antitoxin HigA
MMTNSISLREEIYSDLPIPPGEFLVEVLEDLGMGKDELARRMNRPAAKLSAIFRGDKAITPDTALQLEKVTSVPAHIWIGLEAEYRLTLAKLQEQKEIERRKKQTPLISKFCYNELSKYGYVEQKSKPIEKVEELQKFLGVTSLLNLDNVKRYQPFFRQNINKNHKVSSEAVISWLRIGEIEAYKIDTKPFDSEKLYKLLPTLRGMTTQLPEKFQKELKNKFSDAGIALIIVPHLPKTCAHGATFWLNKNKAVLMITIRGRWADMFWFSLFHELGHILLHSKQQVYIESDDVDFVVKSLENEANEFASDNLVPAPEYEDFVERGAFYKQDILKFAKQINIHPGIVVGRLQHDEKIPPSWHNDLRERYT